MTNRHNATEQAQVILEFTMCMIIVLLLIYGCIMVFRWSGMDLAERRIGHDESITTKIEENWGSYTQSPLNQIRSDFFKSGGMGFVFNNW